MAGLVRHCFAHFVVISKWGFPAKKNKGNKNWVHGGNTEIQTCEVDQ